MEEDSGSGGGGGNLLTRMAHALRLTRYGAGSGLSTAATWVAMISALTGGFIGLGTYQTDVSKRVDQKVEKTFEMIHHYNSEELYDARTRVLSYVMARRACDSRLIDRELTDNDFVRTLEFFDLVHACTEADLCDEETAIRFFGPHANFKWPVLERTVGQMRDAANASVSPRADPSFAIGMKALAITPIEAPACDGNF